MMKNHSNRAMALLVALALAFAVATPALACSAMELTSAEGDAWWFRTCDMTDVYNVFGENGSYIAASSLMVYPAGVSIPFATGSVVPTYTVIGTSFSKSYSLLDGMNSAGLTGGLLMFNEGTTYPGDTPPAGMEMVASMESVNWLLAQCANVDEVIAKVKKTVVKAIEVEGIPGSGLSATMHLMFTDKTGKSVVLENGDPNNPGVYTIYEDCNGVMTNSPHYSTHQANLKAYHNAVAKNETPAIDKAGYFAWALDNSGKNGAMSAADDPQSRYVRLSAQRELIEGGKNITNDKMLAIGSSQMARVTRPLVEGTTINYTMYTVAYDLARGVMYFRPQDTIAWSSISVAKPPKKITGYVIARGATGGIVTKLSKNK